MGGLSIGEKQFIEGGIAQDIRTDGRQRRDFRPISVETGVIPHANGSARVKLGATDVIASVKAELGRPSSLHPDKGKVAIFVDCSPTAAPMFDGLVICSDGNILDALAAAVKVSLSNTDLPKVNVDSTESRDEEPEVNISDEEFLQFDTSGIPAVITLTKVGKHYIVDATSEEESHMSLALTVSVNRHGQICGITKRGGAGMDPSVLLDMISVAKSVSQHFISVIDSKIAAAEAAEADS